MTMAEETTTTKTDDSNIGSPVKVAEPIPGSERTTTLGVILADCRNCPEAIWSGESWEWEHVDNDEMECTER